MLPVDFHCVQADGCTNLGDVFMRDAMRRRVTRVLRALWFDGLHVPL